MESYSSYSFTKSIIWYSILTYKKIATGEKNPDLMESLGVGSFKIVAQECIKSGSK